jgi:hypothetical protein
MEELIHLRGLDHEERFAIWKNRYTQHCYNFHFDGCQRDRTCAFLHADVSYDDGEAYG